ncbi:hypothetical protein LKD38_06690 [Oscillospiraceae bacterium CLA-AA-H269]|nr:hypothetical protein [Hominicoprocola fusiformis]
MAVPLLCKDSLRSAPRLSDLSGQFDFAPSRRYDSRALTGAPIVPLPRNWLASSATGGASPISSSRKVLFLTRTPQGDFSCRAAAIHLLSSEITIKIISRLRTRKLELFRGDLRLLSI